MATRKRAPKALTKAKRSKSKEITAELVRSLPKWEPMLTREQVEELERRSVGGGDIAFDRRITFAMSARTQEQLVTSWKDGIAEDDGKCEGMFEILASIARFENAARAMLDLAKSASARILGAGLLADDEAGKHEQAGAPA